MRLKWFDKGPRECDSIESLVAQLTAPKPSGWRGVDTRTPRWEKEIWPLWDNEVRVLKLLKERGPSAEDAVPAIATVMDEVLWDRWVAPRSERKPRSSFMGTAGLVAASASPHDAVLFKLHAGSLIWALNALNGIRGEQADIVPLLIEVFEESAPLSDMAANMVAKHSSDELTAMREVVCTGAVGALTRLSDSIPETKREQLADRVIEAARCSRFATATGLGDVLVDQWKRISAGK